MYEEPKGQRRRKFSRKCKRKGKNCQHGKPQQKAGETAVKSPSSGSQSEGETESGENVSSTKFFHVCLPPCVAVVIFVKESEICIRILQ